MALFISLPAGAQAGREDGTAPVDYPLVTRSPMTVSVLLFEYLQSIYGDKTIAGQMDLTWNDQVSMIDRVYADTGRYPALQGFDFMNIGQTDEAAGWWQNAAGTGRNGIVTFCWHWRDPLNPAPDAAFYTRDTTFRIPYDSARKTWETDSNAYKAMMLDIDRVAAELKKMEEMQVPVLWRPLHEASGGWFWWGASGPAAFKALWNLLFERLNDVYGLKNLIWVWNGQNNRWYPGDESVDIIGEDVYPGPKNYGSNAGRFRRAVSASAKGKMAALTENGAIPHPDAMSRDNARWLYFMTWNDSSGQPGADDKTSFWTGEYHNENSHKREVYSHPDIITLDELPRFTVSP